MELPSSEVVSQTPSKHFKLQFCGCMKIEPATYALHIYNFVLLATFVGLVFLFVLDGYWWFDGAQGTIWPYNFVKIASGLFLIALAMYVISVMFVDSMKKHTKCFVVCMNVIILLNVMAILLLVIMLSVRLVLSWHDVDNANMSRIFIYGGWVLGVVCLGRFFLWIKTSEETDRMEKVLSAMRSPPA